MPMLRKTTRCFLVALICVGLVQSASVLAQTEAPTPLPPAAQEALEQGISAAQATDFPLAIKRFEEARKIAPDAPIIFLNLGLAEGKMPNRELRAIAWFAQYLEVYPDAPNAAAVRAEIAALEARFQQTLGELIDTVGDLAFKSGGKYSFGQVAVYRARAGNFAAAKQLIAAIPEGDNFAKKNAIEALTRAQVQADITAASESLAQGHIAEALSRLKDARMQLADMPKDTARMEVETVIAAHQLYAHDTQAAWDTLASVSNLANGLSDGYYKYVELISTATRQFEAGDIAGAHLTLKAARGASVGQNTYWSAMDLSAITKAQVDYGDIEGLRAAVNTSAGEQKFEVVFGLVLTQLKAGNVVGASESVLYLKSQMNAMGDGFATAALSALAGAQFKAGDIAAAQATAEEAIQSADGISEDWRKCDALTLIAQMHAEMGDAVKARRGFSDAERMAQDIKIPDVAISNLIKIAEIREETGDPPGALETLALAMKVAERGQRRDPQGKDQNASRWQRIRHQIAIWRFDIQHRDTPPSIWLSALDGPIELEGGVSNFISNLNTPPFLDLQSYLLSIPSNTQPYVYLSALSQSLEALLYAKDALHRALIRQRLGLSNTYSLVR